ncbi:hypothetical protein [Metabacillus bambusae]|uniref:Uncharacterized protein n=1 Tax=Metabacillus bambusae TaxID=2795218 RepID=A0ABS3N0V2_9BACI|nr:hypothetical protein [Metabacillus bambusae]MBO1511721.1 hypothetical protein [Metabacillus bambusae]
MILASLETIFANFIINFATSDDFFATFTYNFATSTINFAIDAFSQLY